MMAVYNLQLQLTASVIHELTSLRIN